MFEAESNTTVIVIVYSNSIKRNPWMVTSRHCSVRHHMAIFIYSITTQRPQQSRYDLLVDLRTSLYTSTIGECNPFILSLHNDLSRAGTIRILVGLRTSLYTSTIGECNPFILSLQNDLSRAGTISWLVLEVAFIP